ncbi:MAG: tetratricopeptide repeat protein [Planctomycetota bacterium]
MPSTVVAFVTQSRFDRLLSLLTFAATCLLVLDVQGQGPAGKGPDLERERDSQYRSLQELIKRNGPDVASVQAARVQLSQTLIQMRDYKAALTFLVPAETALLDLVTARGGDLVDARLRIATCWAALGDRAKALRAYRTVVDEYTAAVMPGRDDYLQWLRNTVAAALHGLQDFAQARDLYQKAYTAQKESLGEADASTLNSLMGLSACLVELKQYAEARPLLEQAVAGLEKHHPEDSSRIILAKNNLACVYLGVGDFAAARELLEALLAAIPAGSSDAWLPRNNLVDALAGLEEWALAIDQLDRIIEAMSKLTPAKAYRERLNALRKQRTDYRKKLEAKGGSTNANLGRPLHRRPASAGLRCPRCERDERDGCNVSRFALIKPQGKD